MSIPKKACERAILVHVEFSAGRKEGGEVEEFKELAKAAGAEVVDVVITTRRAPDSKYYVGSGKVEEIRGLVLATQADLILFNHTLTPAQERNLERAIQCRIVDRTGLILDIFARRARSFEGKLQVELALLKYLSTRLVRGWTHLERQRGGIGLRGPGETQLEVDRRLIRQRIKVITARLAKIRKQREQSRRSRRKAAMPTVALVGYTNAGKSTLFNWLTHSEVYVENQLFATLDPTLRRMTLRGSSAVILADTVGFIRQLPHGLVEAFQATLEEVSEADLLLHVIDASDENKDVHMIQVEEVLSEIGAAHVPRLLIYNKIDLCQGLAVKSDRNEWGQVDRIFVSAEKKQGLAEMTAAIIERLGENMIEGDIVLLPEDAPIRAMLYERDVVLSEKIDDAGCCHLRVVLTHAELEKFHKMSKRE
ncbi:MAG TPA: ribosome rescue GTPase HflX [Gammaproteobacteria bacterium]|jgi:GTP-binding protein HflX|nr:ribosome rescue GTPase HflX [Gammaproteobacteria bacterium]